jgi:hypothetical protein
MEYQIIKSNGLTNTTESYRTKPRKIKNNENDTRVQKNRSKVFGGEKGTRRPLKDITGSKENTKSCNNILKNQPKFMRDYVGSIR